MHIAEPLKFKAVFDSTALNDGLYFFLQLVHRLYPEDAFHYLIAVAIKEKKTDEEIYKEVQNNLPGIKPFLQKLTYTNPSARRLKNELRRQTLAILGDKKVINGCLQVGSSTHYLSALKRHIKLKQVPHFINVPDYSTSITEIIESCRRMQDESLDLVACYSGLHHYAEEYQADLIRFVHRVLRRGGVFILREYDVNTPLSQTFISVIRSVINISTNVPWSTNATEYRSFRPAEEWSNIITSFGFEDSGKRIVQYKDPTLNTLMGFVKL